MWSTKSHFLPFYRLTSSFFSILPRPSRLQHLRRPIAAVTRAKPDQRKEQKGLLQYWESGRGNPASALMRRCCCCDCLHKEVQLLRTRHQVFYSPRQRNIWRCLRPETRVSTSLIPVAPRVGASVVESSSNCDALRLDRHAWKGRVGMSPTRAVVGITWS